MDRDLFENILTISQRMAETRALKPLLDYVMDEAMKLVGAERGFVVLVGPDGALDFRVKRSKEGQELEDAEEQISKSILNQVVESGDPLLLVDAMADSRFDRAKSVMNLKLLSIMCAPLTARGETIGAIYVDNRLIRGQFGDDDLSLLNLFANQAAISIENARLNDDLEERVAARTGELRQAMAQLQESWASLMEANNSRTDWMNNVTHDLRTGLSVVSGALTLLQMPALGDLSEKQVEVVAKAANAVEHTLNLINDLFDLSKIEAGGLTLYPEVVDLPDFLGSVYEVGLGLSWPETVTLELDISPDLPELLIDPVRIRQVLLNLLSNANKFTDQGSVTLYARYLADLDEVIFKVIDTGEGIAAEQLDRLFDRFFQNVDENRERRRKGSGLGLAICHALVEMHGGRIWVESTVGVGSIFTFTLPVTPPPELVAQNNS